MAEYVPIAPLEEINGAIGKSKRMVCRRKHYKIDDQGHTIAGKKETYKIENKRDYNMHPQVGLEKASSEAFSQARQLRIKVQTEMPELYAKWKAAFLKQTKKADKDSPLVKGQPKIYMKLDNYMEAKIRLRGMDISRTDA